MPMIFNLLTEFPNILKTFSQINAIFDFLNLIFFQFFIIIYNCLCIDPNNFPRINLWAKMQAHSSKYEKDIFTFIFKSSIPLLSFDIIILFFVFFYYSENK